jgi:DNA invertase Pin-like site-specific DNA recombinase
MKYGYARVSTDDQQPAMQIDALRADGCERVFTEILSGAQRQRPVLEKCLLELAPGDVLVVWRLDRLGRSLAHLIHLAEDLGRRRVGFRSLTEAIDTTSAQGRLVFHLMSSLAQFERELLAERAAAGLAAARKRGVAMGRPRAMSIEQVEHAKTLASDGKTVAQIAVLLGVSRSTVYRTCTFLRG